MLERFMAIHGEAWRDAARLGLQSAVAAAAAYAAATWLELEEFLVVMMAVTSLQRTVGGTIGQAVIRLQSALAGSLLGLVCLLLLPEGWGTAVALAVALFVVGASMTLRPNWSLAVVPAVGMSLGGTDGGVVETAAVTSLGIVVGALIGVVVSLLVWSDRAEARFERQFRAALRAAATRLSDAVEATLEAGHEPRVPEHVGAWNEAVWLAQESLSDARFVDSGGMQRRLDALRELHESIVILDRAAEVESPPPSVEVMRDQVHALRRDTCAVLTGMAEGRDAGGRMGAIDATLGELRRRLDEEDPHSPEHEVHAAVAFGLREVRRTLAALVEVQGGGGQEAGEVR
ncbi:MAG: hypothetical protein AVDCRST_MAG15-1828 [uncultured Rubellimicrobium sp.]|uniref:FUSC family protein n=1 Tax=uncultured Rubellimicrobium sp. TaxID=543078 RepID=A0A6J4PGF8_9RHOB|nr:MAG: hypothetical protein AVDCRST_MAG15-1828 [uncultured Rubellimicrobium sp.]